MILPNSDSEHSSSALQPDSEIGPHDLDFDILGAKFSITVGEDPVYLEEIMAQFRFAIANTQSISGMKNPLNVAVLTGFLICDEFNKYKIQNHHDQLKTEQLLDRAIQRLIARIDEQVPGD